jgi:hypothetical protein
MTQTFKLERLDGTPADPPTLKTAVPDWRAGDTVPLGGGRTLRVVDVKPVKSPNEDAVLVVVEDELFEF